MKELFSNILPTGKTCRNCENRKRYEVSRSGLIKQYCGVIKSNRTFNGLLKIKVTNKACNQYKEQNKIRD